MTLELGGKSPIVVFPDADVDRAVRTVSAAIFANSGECYEAGSRLFIHEDVADDLLDGLVAAAGSMTIGDPSLGDTDLGPKVSDVQMDRTLEYLQRAREADATFLTGGGRPDDDGLSDGCFVSSAILADLDHDHEAVQEEIIGRTKPRWSSRPNTSGPTPTTNWFRDSRSGGTSSRAGLRTGPTARGASEAS